MLGYTAGLSGINIHDITVSNLLSVAVNVAAVGFGGTGTGSNITLNNIKASNNGQGIFVDAGISNVSIKNADLNGNSLDLNIAAAAGQVRIAGSHYTTTQITHAQLLCGINDSVLCLSGLSGDSHVTVSGSLYANQIGSDPDTGNVVAGRALTAGVTVQAPTIECISAGAGCFNANGVGGISLACS